MYSENFRIKGNSNGYIYNVIYAYILQLNFSQRRLLSLLNIISQPDFMILLGKCLPRSLAIVTTIKRVIDCFQNYHTIVRQKKCGRPRLESCLTIREVWGDVAMCHHQSPSCIYSWACYRSRGLLQHQRNELWNS